MPQVSVIIPTYNRAQLLGRAIESVIQQTHEDFQLIIVDDGSTDDTRSVVEGYNDPRIDYIPHETNRGIPESRNTGLDRAEGAYIAFLDSDDEWLPNKLEHQIELLRTAGSEVGLLYSRFRKIYPNGRSKLYHPPSSPSFVGYPSRWLVKSQVFSEIGRFDPSMPAWDDAEMCIRIAQKFKLLYDSRLVMNYYLGGDSHSLNRGKVIPAARKMLDRYSEQVNKRQLAQWHFVLGSALTIEGNVRKGRSNFHQALQKVPYRPKYVLAYLGNLLGRKPYLLGREIKHKLQGIDH